MTKARKKLKTVYQIMYKNDPDTLKNEIEKLDNMSDKELKELILNDEIYLYVKPFKEPSLKDIAEAANFLGIELDEKLILPNQGNIVTDHPCPVGYVPVKILEQLVKKKVVTSHDIAATDPVTGQLTTKSKTRMMTAPELVNMFANSSIVSKIFPEFLLARSDDQDAAMDMQKQIADTGRFSINKLSSSGIGQVQKTVSYYLIGAGIDNNIRAEYQVKVDGKQQDNRRV